MRTNLAFGTASTEKEQKEDKNFISSAITAAFVVLIVTSWWPEVIPFEVFGAPFWGRDTSTMDAIMSVWFIFAWGVGINFIIGLSKNSEASGISRFLRRKREPDSVSILAGGTVISFMAGTLEELSFRWLIFLGAIPGILILNWFWGGILGVVVLGLCAFLLTAGVMKATNELIGIMFGLACLVGVILLGAQGGFPDPVRWLYEWALFPMVDWVTMGYLTEYLYHPHSWAVGAAIIGANAAFRDGHKYQGLLGTINAWFLGMIFFWVVFTYGLFAAMVVHFLYDLAIFATVAFMRLFR
jgi:hypothetical protein